MSHPLYPYDRHSNIVTWVYNAFLDRIRHELKYDCIPDPKICLNGGKECTPDLISINKGESVIIILDGKSPIDGIDFQEIGIDINKLVEKIGKYKNISQESIQEIFSVSGIQNIETVAATDFENYQHYETDLKSSSDQNNIPLWIIKDNMSPKILQLIEGSHSHKELQDKLSAGISLPPHPLKPLFYTRHTNLKIISYVVLERLIDWCVSERINRFNVEDIDFVATKFYEYHPILGHLTRDERLKKWKNVLKQGISTGFLEEAEERNYYKWKKDIPNLAYNYISPLIDNLKQKFKIKS